MIEIIIVMVIFKVVVIIVTGMVIVKFMRMEVIDFTME